MIAKKTQKKEADEYFERFFEEKDNIEEFHYIKTKENHVYEFNYTKEDMVKILKSFDAETKQKIMKTMTKIDFHNGDINDFLNYVFKGYVRMQIGEPLETDDMEEY